MARAVVPLNFNAFLEKAKLKDDGSNYTDWVHNLRIILIATKKNYILEAPLGAKAAAGATPDVMNVWQSKADDYSIVQCAMLYGLEPGLQRRFECDGAYEMLHKLKLIFQANARLRDMKSPISSTAAKLRRIVLSVSIYSECLGTTIT